MILIFGEVLVHPFCIYMIYISIYMLISIEDESTSMSISTSKYLYYYIILYLHIYIYIYIHIYLLSSMYSTVLAQYYGPPFFFLGWQIFSVRRYVLNGSTRLKFI